MSLDRPEKGQHQGYEFVHTSDRPRIPRLWSRSMRKYLYGVAHVTGWEPYDLHDLWQFFPGLDLFSPGTDPAQHLRTSDTGPTADDLYDLYDLYDVDMYDLYDLGRHLSVRGVNLLASVRLTLHATRRTPYGASRWVHAIYAWWVTTRRASSRHCSTTGRPGGVSGYPRA